ncbi:unnamed protein product [Rhizophagus irregularis]|nr:unnamed protein product [Rhizophagus irregularis]
MKVIFEGASAENVVIPDAEIKNFPDEFNTWPLKIKNHELCSIYIGDVPVVSSDAEFVIKKRKIFVLVVEDKHLQNVGHATGYGETQIAVEILACGTTIPALYWKELQDGLPKTEVKIERWPAENGLETGYDLAEPDGRQNALTALIRLRESLLSQDQQGQSSTSHTAVASQGQQGQSSTSHIAMVPQDQQEQSSTSHIAMMPQDQQELSEPSEQSSKKKGKLREV